ncbi:hypothetical protein RUM43_013133 [Polyplax serrata]|uniref:SAP domain-containing protein n=1 Tax=Polyplax serrata TaxID=468196 RepID=A0AAN8S2Z5_POLSC
MSLTPIDRDLDFNKWKVADLRRELKTRGLSVEGKKNELVERLQLAVGESSLLDDTVNDQDEILDDDVLSDDETFEDSELTKVVTPEKTENQKKLDIGLKRKYTDNTETTMKQPKKIVLNRNISTVDKDISKTEGKENQEKTTLESSSEEKGEAKLEALSPQERLERRAAKFGLAMSTEAKKEARAARFGLQTTTTGKVGGLVNTNIDVLKKRAERFGSTLPGSILESAEAEERRKKREERFGKVEKVTSSFKGKFSLQAQNMDEKKRQRAERFKTK